MATGRIGVTPVLRTRWSKLPTTGTTVLSGLDDNSVALVYDAGYEAVYRNGVLLSRGNDYTATNGTTITLIDATLATDIIEIFANDLVPLTDAISKGQYNAKGALLSATAASTPAVLTVGANDTVLTADSSTATGLKWAAPAAGGMTELASGSFPAAATLTLSSIDQTYKNLMLVVRNVYLTVDDDIKIKFNATVNSNYPQIRRNATNDVLTNTAGNGTAFIYLMGESTSIDNISGQVNNSVLNIYDYANAVAGKNFDVLSQYKNATYSDKIINNTVGSYSISAAITSITLTTGAGNFSGGTYILYGVK